MSVPTSNMCAKSSNGSLAKMLDAGSSGESVRLRVPFALSERRRFPCQNEGCQIRCGDAGHPDSDVLTRLVLAPSRSRPKGE